MHKKLAEDLTSLAHSILRMKDKDDVFALKAKAHQVYEKLALLAYVEEYINTTPSAEYTKEELIATIIEAEALKETTPKVEVKKEIIEEVNIATLEIDDTEINDVVEQVEIIEEIIVEEKIEGVVLEEEPTISNDINETITEEVNVVEQTVAAADIIEQPFDEIQELLFGDSEIEVAPEIVENTEDSQEIDVVIEEEEIIEEVEIVVETDKIVESVEANNSPKITTLEEELGDTISVDVMANLFEKVEPKKTLHDKLQNTIRIDLNDRIAFVKNLFDGSQEDFNRVISQLNTKNSEMEAKNFIQKMIKPDYDWSDKEEYELRLMEIIERKFVV